MGLSKAKKLMLSAEKEYLKKKQGYKVMLWKYEIKEGGVTTIKSFEYARPLVTFNGKWDVESFIKLKEPLKTRFVEVNKVIYYPVLYSSGKDGYSYELYTKEDYLYREMQKD